jgi:hypothetical protein
MKTKTAIDTNGKLVYTVEAIATATYLGRKPGRYYVSDNIHFVVTGVKNMPPYFQVIVSKKAKGRHIELCETFPVTDPLKYWAIEGLAFQKRAEFHIAIQQELSSSLLQKEMREAEKRKQANERKRLKLNSVAIEAARKDVAGVLERYGPHLRMNEPYFIQQWM